MIVDDQKYIWIHILYWFFCLECRFLEFRNYALCMPSSWTICPHSCLILLISFIHRYILFNAFLWACTRKAGLYESSTEISAGMPLYVPFFWRFTPPPKVSITLAIPWQGTARTTLGQLGAACHWWKQGKFSHCWRLCWLGLSPRWWVPCKSMIAPLFGVSCAWKGWWGEQQGRDVIVHPPPVPK